MGKAMEDVPPIPKDSTLIFKKNHSFLFFLKNHFFFVLPLFDNHEFYHVIPNACTDLW